MNEGKKILIIDDSALMRSVMSDIIRKDGRYKVEDICNNGVDGLDLLVKNNGLYDIVLLDVNMPKMNGLDVLTKIEQYRLNCKVIMVSTHVREGSKETIIALERGAVDVVLKPTGINDSTMEGFGSNLLKTIDAALESKSETKLKKVVLDGKETTSVANSKKDRGQAPFVGRGTGLTSGGSKKLVAIACSTGGPKILKDVVSSMEPNINAPVVLVQHMPSGFTKSLAERLNDVSRIKVSEANDGDILEKGHIYIAQGGKQMRIVDGAAGTLKIKLTNEEPRDGLRPCANIMYESIAECDVDEVICAVLTGMGSDGTIGIGKLKEIKKTYVIAQDAATCIVYGMPRAVVGAGLADKVLPHNEIAKEILKNVGVLNDGR